MAFETAIADSNCGPPMTVIPTAATEVSLTSAYGARDEIAIDVAVDDDRGVLALERRRQAHDGEGKARMAVRGDRRVDEQDVLRSAHDGRSAGTSRNKVNLSLTKRRSANTWILNPWLWNSLRKTRPSPKVDSNTNAVPPGFK